MTAGIIFEFVWFFLMCVLFYFVWRSIWRGGLRRASKTAPDLPGGDRAFVTYLIVYSVSFSLTLVAMFALLDLFPRNLASWEFWVGFAIAIAFGAALARTIKYVVALISPSMKRIEDELLGLRKRRRAPVSS